MTYPFSDERETSENSEVEYREEIVNNTIIKQYPLPKYDKKNIFSLPSVVGIFMFVLSTSFMSIYNAVEDEKITLQEKLLIAYLITGGLSEVLLRGSEGATAVYTPNGLPGKNKDDYDSDGIPNEEDSTPQG